MLQNYFAGKFMEIGADFGNKPPILQNAGPKITSVEEGLAFGGRWDGSYCGPDE
jgi:hypothetical protein